MDTINIGGRRCQIIKKGTPDCVIYWGIDAQERESQEAGETSGSRIERLAALLDAELSLRGHAYLLAAYEVENWNRDFSPWAAPAVFGNEDFAGWADRTRRWLLEEAISCLETRLCAGGRADKRFLGGYSLSGLFSLWTFYESGVFDGVASCSGSLWYPGWVEYVRHKAALKNSLVYLSLGDKEELTRNRAMACVGENTRFQYELVRRDEHVIKSILEWNRGGHFREPDVRMAKGFAWLVNNS